MTQFKRLRIGILLFISFYIFSLQIVNAQNVLNLDSIIQVQDTVDNDSVRLDLYAKLGMRYNVKNPLASIKWLKKGLALANELDSKKGKVECYRYLASSYRLQGLMDTSLIYGQKALRLSEEMGDKEVIALVYLTLGNTYANNEFYEDAMERYSSALELFKELKLDSDVAMTYSNLIACYALNKQIDSALVYFEKSREIYERLGNKSGLGFSHMMLANQLYEVGRGEEAVYHAKQSIELTKGSLRASFGDSYWLLGKIYNSIEKYDSAIVCLEKAEKDFIQKDNILGKNNVYEQLATAYEGNGDLKNALKYIRKYLALREENILDNRLDEIKRLKEELDVERKEKENEALHQANMLKDATLENQQYIIAALIVLVLLIVSVFVIFFYRRQLDTVKKKAELEQKALRAQLNPHFIFNSMNSIQSFIASDDSDMASIYLAQFSVLIRKVLEYSREKVITLEQELSVLKNYVELEKLRFSNEVTFEIELDDEIDPEATLVPPLLFQPFVENALIHGLKEMETNGVVKLVIKRVDNQLSCQVIDNGNSSLEEPKVFVNGKTQSLGHVMIEERMELLRVLGYKQSSVKLSKRDVNKGEKGTIVDLILPLQVA